MRQRSTARSVVGGQGGVPHDCRVPPVGRGAVNHRAADGRLSHECKHNNKPDSLHQPTMAEGRQQIVEVAPPHC